MEDPSMTNQALIQELASLRQKIEELEQSESARKQAEEDLLESGSLLQSLIDYMHDAMIILNWDGFILFANRAAARMVDLERPEEFAGHNMIEYLHPDSFLKAAEDLEAVKADKMGFLSEYKLCSVTGRHIWVESMGGKIIFRNASANLVCIRDITERRQTEETLRRTEDNFRRSLDESPVGVRIVDKEGETLYANRALLDIYGYDSVDELKETPVTKLYSSKSFNEYLLRKEKRRRGEYLTAEYEISIIRKDGEVHYLHASRKEILWDGKRQFQVIYLDITDRKKAEEQKRQMEERLQRAEKMEALGTLAGGVAHDLNNLLGVVVGYAEMLLDDVDKSSPISSRLGHIMNSGERAAAIVQDLLTLARRGVSGRQVLNLNTIIADCQQSPELEKLSSYHPFVKIKTDLEPALLNISGSSVHLGKTLLNLVSNAGEAMPNGGMVTIKTSNQYLDKPIQGYDEVREGDYVVLSVSDTGEGIPASNMKRIFEPFYTKKIMGRSGTGLGLAVVWGTVKDHHGYINVQSEEGKGSTFTLYFPVTREDISADRIAVALSEYMGRGESILIVDDVKGQRDLASEMLKRLNYSVASVSSGEEAVASLKEHPVDLIVLDMIMDPGMDGLDTYRRILEIHPKQKAIIVSGFSETHRVSAAQGLGAGAYVRKPYVTEKLAGCEERVG